jgi:hypothetical protein
VRWSSPVEVIWARYREVPPQHGGLREAGFAQVHHAARLALLTGTRATRPPSQRSPALPTAMTAPAASPATALEDPAPCSTRRDHEAKGSPYRASFITCGPPSG